MSEVIVVTGASAGVGRATAVAFARRGARVGLLARGRDRLEATRDEVEAAGGEAIIVVTDVADADQVERAAAAVEEALGPIEVWVNNAMATIFSPFAEITAAEYRRATEVTYLGYVWGTMAALRRMLPRDRGVIVQVGSALAYRAIPLQAAYCGAKHAIQGFTESLRCELLHEGSGVQVTMVQLPALNTPQFDWGRSRMPREPQPIPPIYQPEVELEWVEADAEALPFDDGEFDVVTSSFGAMFAPDHQKVADEFVRVCRSDGTIGMLNFTPEGLAADLFGVFAPYLPAPSPGALPPVLWGSEEHVRELFGNRVTWLEMTRREYVERAASPRDYVEFFKAAFGPAVAVYASLADQPERAAALDREFLEFAMRSNRGAPEGPAEYHYEYLLVVALKRDG